MIDFFALTLADLEAWLKANSYSPHHAKILFHQIYRELQSSPQPAVGLPQKLCENWLSTFSYPKVNIHQEAHSAYDQSVKFVLTFADGSQIETVLMPEKTRLTLCVSSQVGCRQGCVFCHTGRMGLKRNLSASEIVAQVLTIQRWLAAHPQWLEELRLPPKQNISNVVFMGMGEPLDNVAELIQALRIMTEVHGLQIAPRRLTVSTAGHLDGLKELLAAKLGVALALSVHTADMAERSRLLPINRRFPLGDVLALLRSYTAENNKHILVQYTLIAGVNDSAAHAQKLVAALEGLDAKVNLIPLNPIDPVRFSGPQPDGLRAFQSFLLKAGVRAMVRFSKGQDIAAACGQLVRQPS